MKKKLVTVNTVALHAGVSQTTVSRVLNDSPSINFQTRLAVQRAIKELGYQERSKEKKQNRRIALLMCPLAEQRNPWALDFFNEVLIGVKEILEQEGYGLTIMTLPHEAELTPQTIDLEDTCGIILVNKPSRALVHHLQEFHQPIIIAAADAVHDSLGVDLVINNNIEFGRQACRYMLSHGIMPFALLMPQCYEERITGVTMELAFQGKTLPPECFPVLTSTEISEFIKILMNFLNNNNLPRGLIIQHYDAAQALASILECKHIRVPEDVKIFTFVHSREQNRFPMLLQFPREIGRKAAQGVLNRLRWPNNIPCNYMIPAQLVEP